MPNSARHAHEVPGPSIAVARLLMPERSDRTPREVGALEVTESRSGIRGDFFSLGGLVAPVFGARPTVKPWVCVAIVLSSLALWDPVVRDGAADAVLLGLACYELLIGLTATAPEKRRR